VLRLEAHDHAADRVVFTVADMGAGIEPRVRERMFDPFYTTKAPGQGTGLGLYVAREIVRAQDGTIACETSPGTGTRFRVEFPAAA
jgi:signal transduction histidine kinase